MAIWPASLPAKPLNDSFTWAPVPNVVATPVDIGPPITRRRFTGRTIRLDGALLLDESQWQVLDAFWDVTLAQGALEFIMASWRDGVLRDHKFVPSETLRYDRQGLYYLVPLSLTYSITS